MISGGIKENVLPGQAHCLVNFRILPSDSIDSVVVHAKKVLNDPDVDVSVYAGRFESVPSPVSATDALGFDVIRQSVHEILDNTIVAPGLVFAATDSRYDASISENTYRFIPYVFGKTDTDRIHGVDERIAVENFTKIIQFYVRVIRNGDFQFHC